jgi:8-oxo-dGTP pyrophosphatase MutT (NUDIX family)
MKQSAGLVVIDRKLHDEPCVLCLRAYSSWDFPKGEVEEGEKLLAAAVRELEEETGYQLKDVSFTSLGRTLPWMSCTYGSGKSKKTASYSFAERANRDKEPVLPINPSLGKPEHDEWRWVKISELRELLPERLHHIVTILESQFA